MALRDLKEGLSSARKPDITHTRTVTMVYIARGSEYGTAKGYERANYARPMPDARGDFERFRAYLRAAVSHLNQTLDAMEMHQSQDPHLKDVHGMRAAAFAPDTDEMPGAKVGASLLPHVAHAAASLNMALQQATQCELLPRDPGQPWVKPDLDKIAAEVATEFKRNPLDGGRR